MLVLIAVSVAVLFLVMKSNKEAFAMQDADCPREAIRGANGRIHVSPGNLEFNTLAEYTNYLTGLYANGATCLAPKVRDHRERDRSERDAGGAPVPTENANAVELTSAVTPINKLDDYELSRIAGLENRSRNDKDATSAKLGENVFDWAKMPFNAAERAEREDTFMAGQTEDGWRDPKTGVFFKSAEGADMLPPDAEAEAMREAKLLASYKPTEITRHVVDNETDEVAKLVNGMYANDKRWEPVITKTGENSWEVTELRPRPHRETYAEAQAITLATAEASGIMQPSVKLDIFNRLEGDPYFDKSGVADKKNDRFWTYSDFNKWTPGLERMFAPTAATREWY